MIATVPLNAVVMVKKAAAANANFVNILRLLADYARHPFAPGTGGGLRPAAHAILTAIWKDSGAGSFPDVSPTVLLVRVAPL